MGKSKKMKAALCLALALFIVADSMPVNNSPGSEHLVGMTTVQTAESAIRTAQGSLRFMTKEENNELGEMNAIKTDLNTLQGNLLNAQVRPTEDIHEMAISAIKQEKEQQTAALSALGQVNAAAQGLTEQVYTGDPSETLGEQQAATDGSVQQALQDLNEVSAVLAEGTKTSHTLHKIQRMAAEAQDLDHEIDTEAMVQGGKGDPAMQADLPMQGGKGDPTMQAEPLPMQGGKGEPYALGESGPEEEEPSYSGPSTYSGPNASEGALAALSHESQQAPSQASPETSQGAEGALTALSHESQQATSLQLPTAKQHLQNLEQHLQQQEAAVENAEKTDIASVTGLIQKLD